MNERRLILTWSKCASVAATYCALQRVAAKCKSHRLLNLANVADVDAPRGGAK
jgi:hypothetical protein